MKAFSFAVLALVSTLHPQAAAPPQDPGLLRRALKANAVDTYTIVDKISQLVKSPVGDMPQNISSTRTLVFTTKTVDDKAGTATIEATTTFDKLEADGTAAAIASAKPAPSTQTGKVDVRGRIAFDKAAQPGIASLLSGAGSALSAGSFVELPEKSVKIGDSWDMVVPKDPLVFTADQKLTAKLTGEKEVDGVAVWVISVRGTIKTAIDSAKIPGAKPIDTPMGPTTIRITGQDDITGEGLVEKSTGRTISMISKAVSKKTVEIVEAGLTLQTDGTVDSTITLKKPGA